MYNIVCNTNTTTNANEIKALTHVESEIESWALSGTELIESWALSGT